MNACSHLGGWDRPPGKCASQRLQESLDKLAGRYRPVESIEKATEGGRMNRISFHHLLCVLVQIPRIPIVAFTIFPRYAASITELR